MLLVVVVVVGGQARLSVASGRGSEVWAPAFLLSASYLFRCALRERKLNEYAAKAKQLCGRCFWAMCLGLLLINTSNDVETTNCRAAPLLIPVTDQSHIKVK